MAVEVRAMTRRSNTLRWAFALALITLTMALPVTEAAARAGSGGSRGSRSYSRPVSPPSSPATPSSPSRQSSAPTPAPLAGPAPRSPFGGLMGGLAGFALGGLLGSVLFGGTGYGGGFGLMDLLLIGGALYLLYRVVTARREPQPAFAGGYDSGRAVELPAERGGVAAVPAAAPADAPSDFERGREHIRQMDPGFDPGAVADAARRLFAEVQRGIVARDMAAVSAHLTARMYSELTAQCDRLRAAGRTNRVESIALARVEPSEAWQESGQDYVTVYLAGSLVDYTVDDASGAVVEGARAPQDFEEFWTFTRPVGPNRWKLSAIQTA
jgi:predicted lipid-binding transport protein (Tim44 family)